MTNKITEQELAALTELNLKASLYKSESEKLILQFNLLGEQIKSSVYGLYLKYKLDPDLHHIDIQTGEIKNKKKLTEKLEDKEEVK